MSGETSLAWQTGLSTQWLMSSEIDERIPASAQGHTINLLCLSLSSWDAFPTSVHSFHYYFMLPQLQSHKISFYLHYRGNKSALSTVSSDSG